METDRENILLAKLKSGERDSEATTLQLTILYERAGEPLKAVPYLQQLLAGTQDADKVSRYNFHLGQLMEQTKDYESAVSYYSQALAVETNHKGTWYFIHNNLGFCLNALGRYDEAGEFLLKAISIDKSLPNAYKNGGICGEAGGQYDMAMELYIMATLADPFDIRAMQHLSRLLTKHPELDIDMFKFGDAIVARKESMDAGQSFEEFMNTAFPETQDDIKTDET